VANTDEAYPILSAQRVRHIIDCVAGDAKNMLHSMGDQHVEQHI